MAGTDARILFDRNRNVYLGNVWLHITIYEHTHTFILLLF